MVGLTSGDDDDVYKSRHYDQRLSTGDRLQWTVQYEYVVEEDQTLRVIEKRFSPAEDGQLKLDVTREVGHYLAGQWTRVRFE